MKCDDLSTSEITVEVQPGETLYFRSCFQRSPHFSKSTVPVFITHAFFKRWWEGLLCPLYVSAGQKAAPVKLGGSESKGQFVQLTVDPGKRVFVRLPYLAAFMFGPGGGFGSSFSPFRLHRWLLQAKSAANVGGPATLLFYGVGLKAPTLCRGEHCFADQLVAFDASVPFHLHGLKPEGFDPAAHLESFTSSTVSVEFTADTPVVKKENRPPVNSNRLKRVLSVIMGIAFGWWAERALLSPPVHAVLQLRESSSTGVVDSFSFPLGGFTPMHLQPNNQFEAAASRHIKAIGLEGLAVCDEKNPIALSVQRSRDYAASASAAKRAIAEIYEEIRDDPGFADATSAIPWCLAGVGAEEGHGFAYLPTVRQGGALSKDPVPTIMLLHGYGGSLLWTLWAIKNGFPEHVILMPSGGVDWGDQDVEQVRQYIKSFSSEVESKREIKLDRPWLIAIGEGGPTGARLAKAYPSRGMSE